MKKKILLLSILCLIGIFMFNFLQINEQENKNKSKNSDDDLHQKEFKEKYNIFSINRPDSIGFANEYVPIFSDDIWERYDKEILKNVYWQSNTMLYFKRANKYFPIIEPILKENNIPDDFKYLAVAESGLENVVSSAGAAGFWQFLKNTAKEYDLEVNSEIDERYHLEKSTEAACKYLKESYEKFGNWTMAAAGYNIGMNGLYNRSIQQKSKNYFDLYLPNETSRYIFRIIAIKEILTNPKKYGFIFREQDLYKLPKTYDIEFSLENVELEEYAIQIGINYKILKELNPWIRNSFITNKKKKRYLITIPKKGERHRFSNK